MSEGKELARKLFLTYAEFVFYLGLATGISISFCGASFASITVRNSKAMFVDGKYAFVTTTTQPYLVGGIIVTILGVIILITVCSSWKQFRHNWNRGFDRI